MVSETPTEASAEKMSSPALGTQQRQAIISSQPFFLHLPYEQVAELAKYLTEVNLAANSIIVQQGALVDSIYFIVQGTAEVTRKASTDAAAPTVFLATLHGGDAIGLNETGYFAPGGVRTATVTASTPILLLNLKISDFHQFLQTYPDFNQAMQAATELMMRMNFIKQVTSFTQLSLGRIRWLAQHLQKITLPANQVIFAEGEPGEVCYLIFTGSVEIRVAQPAADTKILAHLTSSQLFGETALFTTAPRNATARTLEETVLLSIDRQNLLELTAQEATANQAIHALMLDRSRPARVPNIVDYHNTTADGQQIITLKNPVNSHYFRMTAEGWFIWQQVDGYHSLQAIKQNFAKAFPQAEQDLVTTTVFNLANTGFIQIASLDIAQAAQATSTRTLLKWWLSMLSVLAIIVGVFAYSIVTNYQSKTAAPDPALSIAPIVTTVLAVNINNLDSVSPDDVKNGIVPILAIHSGPNLNNHNRDTASFINEFAQLVFFDSDNNGRIDLADPAFSRLELVFLSPDKTQIKHVRVIDAGIRAVQLDKQTLIQDAMANQPEKFNDADNAVIMANGARRPLSIVAINQSSLP